MEWSLPGAEFCRGGVVKAWGRAVLVTKSVWVIADAWGDGNSGCWGEDSEDIGDNDEVVEVKEGEGATNRSGVLLFDDAVVVVTNVPTVGRVVTKDDAEGREVTREDAGIDVTKDDAGKVVTRVETRDGTREESRVEINVVGMGVNVVVDKEEAGICVNVFERDVDKSGCGAIDKDIEVGRVGAGGMVAVIGGMEIVAVVCCCWGVWGCVSTMNCWAGIVVCCCWSGNVKDILELLVSLWSGDMPPSLLDSSSKWR